MPLQFQLITPDRILFEEEVLSISLPTVDGYITVLPHHAALAALLAPGVVRIKRPSGEEEIAVSGGFVQVEEGGQRLRVLAETAERGQELDLQTIEEAKARAQAVLSKAATQDDVSFAAAAAALERELARYKVAIKHRHGTHDTPPIT